MLVVSVNAIQEQHVEVDVCIKGTGSCGDFGKTGFAGQMRGNGSVDDTQYFTHDGRLAGKQKAQRERHSEDPLAHGLMRKDLVYQQGGAVHHSACPATLAKTALLTTERQQFFIVAGFAPDP